MKIVVFGASGGTGLELVGQGLAAGHEVTAYVRNASSVSQKGGSLRVIEGDVTDSQTVSTAIAGQDVVLSALGGKGKIRICAPGMTCILPAMRSANVRRLIVVSSFGAGESRDKSLYSRLLWLTLRARMEDKCDMERMIAASDLDWTLVRPPALTNGEKTGRYRVGPGIRMAITSKISRADVADFMLAEIASPKFVRQAPAIVGGSG